MDTPLRILHLEDNRLDADLVEATLAADGVAADIVRVDSRAAFEEAIQHRPFDVILADYNLPVFDGLSAQILAAQVRPEIPFIFLTGSIGEELAVERLKDGATDYVLKDRMARLPSAVRRALAEKEEREERCRAEAKVLRLNAELEQRVVERTAELAHANGELAVRESELRDAKSVLEDLIAASPSIIFRLHPSTYDVLYASPNVGWLLGYTPAEIVQIEEFWAHHIHPDDSERVLHELRAALQANIVQIEQEYRLCGKDGQHRWFFSLIRVEYDADMQPMTVLGYCRDIADRKRAEEEIQIASRFLDSVVEHIPAMIFVKDARDLRFVRLNRAGEELLGYSREELIGRNDADVFGADAAAMFKFQDEETLRGRVMIDIPEETISTRTRGLRTLHTKKIPLLDAAGEPQFLLGIADDITERKIADEAIKAAHLEAERANLAKSEFLSRMSHDLRTPLNAILGFAQLLELDDSNADNRESVAQILKGGQHLLALINEVLDIARIEAGHLSLSPEPVSATDVVREVVDLVRPLAVARGIALEIEMPPHEVVIQADRARLNQILLNLLSNAVKYNRPNGRVTVSFRELDGRVRVVVTDTGAGIPPAKLALLFQPFERLGAEQTAVEGTGLGLALSRGLAEAMGGALGVDSVVDRGTTFWIELAATDTPRPRVAVALATAAIAAQGADTAGVVLYVEDNPSNVRLMERILQRRPGVRLIHAPTGEDGVRRARAEQPGLIFLDLHLPDMLGEDVLRRLWEDPDLRRIPVAILSADATPDHVRHLAASGAVAYLTKPLEIRQVMQLVDTLLGSADGQESL